MRARTKLLMLLAVVQFTHWFKPSEPYFAAFVTDKYAVDHETLESRVYVLDAPLQAVSALVLAGILARFGAGPALVLCSLAAVGTVMSVLLPPLVLESSDGPVDGAIVEPSSTSPLWALQLSQFFFSASFAATFVIPSAAYLGLPARDYRVVAAVNAFSMLVASSSSSLIGQLLHPSKGSSGSHATQNVGHAMVLQDPVLLTSSMSADTTPFVVSLASAILSLALTIVWAWLPSQRDFMRRSTRLDKSHVLAAVKLSFGAAGPWRWLLLYAVLRGTHTIVMTVWQLAASQVHQSVNQSHSTSDDVPYGYIAFAMYLVAAVGTLSLTRRHKGTSSSTTDTNSSAYGATVTVPNESKWTATAWYLAILAMGAVSLLLCGGVTVLGVDKAPIPLVLFAVFLAAYHTLSELAIAVAAAELARVVRQHPHWHQPASASHMTSMRPADTDRLLLVPGESELMVSGELEHSDHDGNQADYTFIRDGPVADTRAHDNIQHHIEAEHFSSRASKVETLALVACLFVRYMLSLIWEWLLQIVLFPSWESLPNMFKLRLSVLDQLQWCAVVSLAVTLVAIAHVLSNSRQYRH